MTHSTQRLGKLLLALLLALGLTGIADAKGLSKTPPAAPGTAAYETWLTAQVRHRLLMLPYYSVFDNLEYQVNGETVGPGGVQASHIWYSPSRGTLKV